MKNSDQKRHDVDKTFAIVDYVREMTEQNPVSMQNMDYMSICSSCYYIFIFIEQSVFYAYLFVCYFICSFIYN